MDKGFILKDYETTKMYEIHSFKETGLVNHGFTTRVGGFGNPPFDSLNLALHVDDAPETVINNRRVVCDVMGTELDRLVTAQQVHSSNVLLVGEEHAGAGAFSYHTAIPDTDGLVTDRPNLLLATFYADCVPVFILDPVKKVVASVHAGWKGTVAAIGAKALLKMKDVYGTDPADCLVGIGPSIGPCCYEIDDPVIDLFKERFHWWKDVIKQGTSGRNKLDLWETNRRTVIEAGVKANHVEVAKICTCCNQQLLFSYRGSQGKTGRMGAYIMLKPEVSGEG